MGYNFAAIAFEILPLLLTLVLAPLFFVMALWLFTWFGTRLGLDRALGRFAADVVKEYRVAVK